MQLVPAVLGAAHPCHRAWYFVLPIADHARVAALSRASAHSWHVNVTAVCGDWAAHLVQSRSGICNLVCARALACAPTRSSVWQPRVEMNARSSSPLGTHCRGPHASGVSAFVQNGAWGVRARLRWFGRVVTLHLLGAVRSLEHATHTGCNLRAAARRFDSTRHERDTAHGRALRSIGALQNVQYS